MKLNDGKSLGASTNCRAARPPARACAEIERFHSNFRPGSFPFNPIH